jgi:hypothetical protein
VFIPSAADLEDGPPVARILPFTWGVFSCLIVAAYFLGLPSVTDHILPFFVPCPFLLASRKRWVVTAGFLMFSIGCIARAAAVWLIPNFTVGQSFSGSLVWTFLAVQCAQTARMIMARGVRA